MFPLIIVYAQEARADSSHGLWPPCCAPLPPLPLFPTPLRRARERPLRGGVTHADALAGALPCVPAPPAHQASPCRAQPANKTMRTKKTLAKKLKQNRPIPQWIRMRTGNRIRYARRAARFVRPASLQVAAPSRPSSRGSSPVAPAPRWPRDSPSASGRRRSLTAMLSRSLAATTPSAATGAARRSVCKLLASPEQAAAAAAAAAAVESIWAGDLRISALTACGATRYVAAAAPLLRPRALWSRYSRRERRPLAGRSPH